MGGGGVPRGYEGGYGRYTYAFFLFFFMMLDIVWHAFCILYSEHLKQTIMRTYFDVLQMTDEQIKDEVIKNLTREQIIEKAERDQEKPMGYLLTYLKDMYLLPKTKGWVIAEWVLEELGIPNV